MKPLQIFVGYDEREAIAYHAFCQSVLERSTEPVSFTPLAPNTFGRFFSRTSRHDGSNSFTYSRFLVPLLMGYEGWALFADGDMTCNADIAELFDYRDRDKAVMVVKHDYTTKYPIKYLGARNENYPRKNWSSVVLWNCSHPANRVVTAEMVSTNPGSYLHRFAWLQDSQIGALPATWNWLVMESERNDSAKLYHYTVGTPCFDDYAACENSDLWHKSVARMNRADQS